MTVYVRMRRGTYIHDHGDLRPISQNHGGYSKTRSSLFGTQHKCADSPSEPISRRKSSKWFRDIAVPGHVYAARCITKEMGIGQRSGRIENR